MSVRIRPTELLHLARLIRQASGIVLDERKAYLFETRLGPLLARVQCANYAELHERARSDSTGKVASLIIGAISTQETSFFRDRHPFYLLAHRLIPEHFEKVDPKRLRIWCAAVSTGQELYSVAMVLKEILGDLCRYQISILGTDICDEALAAASRGVFSKLEVTRGLDAMRLARHFARHAEGFRVADELRAVATFRKLNLLQLPGDLGEFDLVFCRNVAIYFSPADRARLFDQIAERLRPSGALLIGSTESLTGVTKRLIRTEDRGVVFYRRV